MSMSITNTWYYPPTGHSMPTPPPKEPANTEPDKKGQVTTDRTPDGPPNSGVPTPPVSPTSTADTEQDPNGEKGKEETLIERILARGFSLFVDDIKQEKREEIREKLLRAMGLTEASLSELPPEQRQLIEGLIEEEIKRRMEAARLMNGGKNHAKNEADAIQGHEVPGRAAGATTGALGAPSTAGPDVVDTASAHSIGIGPLLALQEIDAEKADDFRKSHPSQRGNNDLEKA